MAIACMAVEYNKAIACMAVAYNKAIACLLRLISIALQYSAVIMDVS